MAESSDDGSRKGPDTGPETGSRTGFTGLQVAMICLAVCVVAIGATLWVLRSWLFPGPFDAVDLSAREEQVLDDKLNRLAQVAGADLQAGTAGRGSGQSDQEWLRPAPYVEADGSREVSFSERELNGLIARDARLAERLVVDLADDLASARALIPLDPDFPLLGGRTLRVNAGLEIAFSGKRPAIRLRGVSLMGVPVPNAWLGNLKNVDLVAEFGGNPGFWQSFAAGIEDLRIADGELQIRLRE